MKKWYVLYVKSGEEINILDRLKGIEALVPMREVLLRKKSKVIHEMQVLFPGYVFVRLENYTDCYYKIKDIASVYMFLKGNVTDEEMDLLIKLSKDAAISKVLFTEGKLEPLDGPLTYLKDRIIKVDKRRHKVKVQLMVHGELKEKYFYFTIANNE